MIHNSWLSIRDDFVMGNTDPEQGPISSNAEILLGHSHDASVIGGLYRKENTGGREWDLWSLYYTTKVEMDRAVATLASNNPGRTKELGQWSWDGVETERRHPQLRRYMPDGVTVQDVNLLAGQSPRIFS